MAFSANGRRQVGEKFVELGTGLSSSDANESALSPMEYSTGSVPRSSASPSRNGGGGLGRLRSTSPAILCCTYIFINACEREGAFPRQFADQDPSPTEASSQPSALTSCVRQQSQHNARAIQHGVFFFCSGEPEDGNGSWVMQPCLFLLPIIHATRRCSKSVQPSAGRACFGWLTS